MKLTLREFWTVFHGMFLGAVYLLSFTGGLVELLNLRKRYETCAGITQNVRLLVWGTWTLAAACWLTVLSGTYLVYPWYRAASPGSPRSRLLADPALAAWHTFGMEWKEHIAWFAPILATAVAFLVSYYGAELARRDDIRKAALWLFVLAFFMAAVAGLFGAFLNKVAPIL